MTTPTQEYPDRIGLDKDAPATTYSPYIAASTTLRELTPIPVIVGALLGIIFGASSLYLVLRV
jgi:hypothetical protein